MSAMEQILEGPLLAENCLMANFPMNLLPDLIRTQLLADTPWKV